MDPFFINRGRELFLRTINDRILLLQTLTSKRVAPASEDLLCGIANRKVVPATADQGPKATRNIAEEFATLLGKLDQL